MKDAKSKDLSELFNTITVRNVRTDVDEAITRQAKAAGKSKSDFVQELLTATFGDLIGNFVRTSELVKLMDKEVEKLTGARLNEHWFQWQLPVENQQYCRILGISSEEQLQQILMDGMARELLTLRAEVYRNADVIPHGISLYFALFTEAARRGTPPLLREFHRTLFWWISEKQFFDEINTMRKAMRFEPLQAENDPLI
ncbi:hypothetical protein PCO85_05540 [Prodigiosinella aquatilis]|nr:hypothetical protein [Prodigiosinella sp. LS101]WJV54891.1 hypothetical protein PCO85_05540 [Prodigiosinella sp. LS101]WJV59254.1 hypothetical protein PCO84_05550 [Pectobacteriaceae bacterium C111]